jgi:hypothetical protein
VWTRRSLDERQHIYAPERLSVVKRETVNGNRETETGYRVPEFLLTADSYQLQPRYPMSGFRFPDTTGEFTTKGPEESGALLKTETTPSFIAEALRRGVQPLHQIGAFSTE